MAKDLMDYNRLLDAALRSVVKQALQRAAREGLPGAHHFYITFRTHDPGVAVPDHLRAKYPEEMTIVIQHQYWELEVDEDAFEVTLSFRKSPERLRVSFAAITGFFDPSVQFGLQFKGGEAGVAGAPSGSRSALEVAKPSLPPAAKPPAPAPTPARAPTPPPSAGDKVVPLDQFRKK